MKKNLLMGLTAVGLALLSGCNNGKGTTWDDDKTTGIYNSAKTLWKNETATPENALGSPREEFIALKDEDLKVQFADGALPQSKRSPGDPGSGLPGIEAFRAPSGSEASVFRTLYFHTDDHILRDSEYLAIVDRIASYLKAHPEVYLFISGNADERGPEGYNLALGSRRANYIRTKLAEKGVDPDRMHTVSYGKERPADLGHNPDAWAKNRRTEFRIYKRS